jgi:hypothetical protein
VILLFFFESLDPHVTSLFLARYLVIHASYFLVQLLLLQIELPLKTLFLDLNAFNIALQVDALLIKVLHLTRLSLN